MLAVLSLSCTLAQASYAADDAFVITDYDVYANISETNVYDITEVITVNLSKQQHGIFRTIPVNSRITRKDAKGSAITTRVSSSVSDVHVDGYKFSVQSEDDAVKIQIGDPNITVTGIKTYRISYKLCFGNDGVSDFDEVYYNIIGLDWPAPIEHLTFSVTLPKPFDAKKVGFSIGPRGTSGYDPKDLSFSVVNNTISGTVLRALSPYTAVTIRTELPQGYFKVPDLRMTDWIIMGIIGFISLICILLVLIFGLDKKAGEDSDSCTIGHMTPTEIGFILKGYVDERDVVSLLFYWADKEYLTIHDDEKGVELHKIKDMGKEAKPFEKHMFSNLFKKSPFVSPSDLKYSFYATIESVKSMVRSSFEKDENRIFTERSLSIRPYIRFMIVLPVIIMLAHSLIEADLGIPIIVVIIMSIIFGIFLLLPFFFFIRLIGRWHSKPPKSHKTGLFFTLLFSAAAFTGFLWITLTYAKEPALPWFAVFATFVIGFCSVFIRKRTSLGVEWLGRILRFRENFVKASQDGFNNFLQQDPGYFYHVLPYAYVLNLVDNKYQNFEISSLTPPQWYYGYESAFNYYLFLSFFNRTMSTFEYHMTSVPTSGSSSSSSGSGFSGGSSSGGGGGGGGGGVW